MGLDDLTHDGQAEPATAQAARSRPLVATPPPFGRRPRGGRSSNARQHRSITRCADGRAFVPRRRSSPSLGSRTERARWRWTTRLATARRSSVASTRNHLGGGLPTSRSDGPRPIRLSRAGELLGDAAARRGRRQWTLSLALRHLAPSEREQVVDDVTHAFGGSVDHLGGLTQVLGRRRRGRPAPPRCWCGWWPSGLRSSWEASWTKRRWFSNARSSLPDHGVEGVGQPRELVVGAVERDTSRQIGGLDVTSDLGDTPDGPQHTTRHHPTHPRLAIVMAPSAPNDHVRSSFERPLVGERLDGPELGTFELLR